MSVKYPLTEKSYIRDPEMGNIVEFDTPEAREIRQKQMLDVTCNEHSVDNLLEAIDLFVEAGSISSAEALEVVDAYLARLQPGGRSESVRDKLLQFRRKFQ